MIELYFRNITTTLATISLCFTLLYIWATLKHPHLFSWKKKYFYLGAIGLWLCIIVVLRDDYVATMQSNQGFFAIDSKTLSLAYMITILLVTCFVLACFIKQPKRQNQLYWLLTSLILVKIIVIEGSRMLL